MPIFRISLRKGKSDAFIASLVKGTQQALIETFGIPPDDCFAIVDEYDANRMIYPATFLGHVYSGNAIMVWICASPGRNAVTKADLYAAIARNLAADPGLPPSDVLVCLSETARDNWSFGNGLPLYPPGEPA